MPKEVIHSKYTPDLESTYVQVGWTRGNEHVEIATVAPTGRLAIFDPDTGTHILTESVTPGWFMQLDRNGINQMIRVLRRARDQAFGEDA